MRAWQLDQDCCLQKKQRDRSVPSSSRWFTYGFSHDAATTPYNVEWLKEGELRIENDMTSIVI